MRPTETSVADPAWFLLVFAVTGWGFSVYAMWEWRRSITDMFDALDEWKATIEGWQRLDDAARAVIAEWNVRGDGGCTRAVRDRLRAAVGDHRD